MIAGYRARNSGNSLFFLTVIRCYWACALAKWRGFPRQTPAVRCFFMYITAKTAAAKKRGPRVVDTGADWLRLDDAFLTQRLDLSSANPEPVAQDLRAVRPERRRSFQLYRLAVDPHRPCRHLVVAVVVVNGLHDAALLEARLVLQFHRVEHGARRHPDGDQFFHRL